MAWIKFIFVSFLLFLVPSVASSEEMFPVYPLPAELELTGQKLDLTNAEIVTGTRAGREVTCLGRYLSSEMADRYGISLIERRDGSRITGGQTIVIGLYSDPVVQRAMRKIGTTDDSRWAEPESYRLAVSGETAVVSGYDLAGLFYGLQSLIQLVESPAPGQAFLKGALINDKPFKPIRGVHVYLPPREEIPFFKNFIRVMAHFKINTLILEVGGGMRLDRHPEINVAWKHLCDSLYDMGDPFVKYGEQSPLGPEGRFQDSVHTEVAGGRWLTKPEVRDLIEFARRHHMNVVPEIQSLTHVYYLVAAHRDMAEIPEADWPDAYDATNPKSYEILFDVIDEYVDVIEPKTVHIGHDEWRAGIKGDTGQVFAKDVVKIYDYLRARGIKTMMWADHFVHGHNVEGRSPAKTRDGVWYVFPSTEGAAEIVAEKTKDILMVNWSWGVTPESDAEIAEYGWKQMFGNFRGRGDYTKWPKRLAQEGVLGAEMSTWCRADELSFGQNGSILNMLVSQNLLWSDHTPPVDQLMEHLAVIMPRVRERLSGRNLPSLDVMRGRPGYHFAPLDITSKANLRKSEKGNIDLKQYPSGEIEYRGMPFDLGHANGAFIGVDGSSEDVNDIHIDSYVSGLIFLHVTRDGGERRSTYKSHYPKDTAELCGYYRIRYTDGLEAVVPIRYGRNIAQQEADFSDQCYFAHTVKLGMDKHQKPILAFASEWVNPRPNRRIDEVDLVGVKVGSGAYPVLLAITIVKQPFTQ